MLARILGKKCLTIESSLLMFSNCKLSGPMSTIPLKSQMKNIPQLTHLQNFDFSIKKQDRLAKEKAKAKLKQAEKAKKQKQGVQYISTEAMKKGIPNTFYRRIIKKINVNKRGRGKFTASHLSRLVNSCKKPQQQGLIFQAYYNFLGHFTIIPSTVADQMILKTVEIKGSFDNILKVYRNHYYLGYFPHYKATFAVLKALFPADQAKYLDLLVSLQTNCLIKINRSLINLLFANASSETSTFTTVSSTIKLIVSRFQNQLLDNLITAPELIKEIGEVLEKKYTIGNLKSMKCTNDILSFIQTVNSIETKDESINFALALFTMNLLRAQESAEALAALKDQSNIQKYLTFLEKSTLIQRIRLRRGLSLKNFSEQVNERIALSVKQEELNNVPAEQNAETPAEGTQTAAEGEAVKEEEKSQ